jgi:hypothetical protein
VALQGVAADYDLMAFTLETNGHELTRGGANFGPRIFSAQQGSQMDKATHFREQATKLRKLADSPSGSARREALLTIVADFERRAAALDTVATSDLVHIDHRPIISK